MLNARRCRATAGSCSIRERVDDRRLSVRRCARSRRTLLPALLDTVMRDDLLIMDRNLCTMQMLLGIKGKRACFIVREHGGSLRQPTRRQAKEDRPLRYGDGIRAGIALARHDGTVLTTLRRVTVELDQPTRDGEREIHILSNLPNRITALRIAELYRKRWKIETAFQELAANFAGEIETLGYPRAALFAFCIALTAFNMLSVIRQRVERTHRRRRNGNLDLLHLRRDRPRLPWPGPHPRSLGMERRLCRLDRRAIRARFGMHCGRRPIVPLS